jgi:tubulin epsilon
MREIVTVSVGQCGNQIGWRFWDVLAREHGASDSADDASLSSFFREAEGGMRIAGVSRAVRARAVLVDMEEGVVSQLQRSPLRGLFDSASAVTDVSGAGNNWAFGYAVCGPAHRARIIDRVRLALEACESPQAFLLLHSLGGGTGSGVGSYLLEQLADEFPEPYRLTASLFPSDNDDVITSPYNALLATSRLIESADAVFSIENQALLDVAAAAGRGALDSQSPGKTVGAGTGAAAAAAAAGAAGGSAAAAAPDRRAPGGPQSGAAPAPALPTAAFQSVLEAADAALAASSTVIGSKLAGLGGAAAQKRPAAAAASAAAAATVPSRAAVAVRGSMGAARPRVAAARRAPPQKETVAQRLMGSQGIGRSAATRVDSSGRTSPPAPALATSSSGGGGSSASSSAAALSAAAAAAAAAVVAALPSRESADDDDAASDSPADAATAPSPALGARSGTAWDAMNELVARMLSDVTAGMRFPGSLNLDLNEIASTLVPFPRMHFLSTRCGSGGRRKTRHIHTREQPNPSRPPQPSLLAA